MTSLSLLVKPSSLLGNTRVRLFLAPSSLQLLTASDSDDRSYLERALLILEYGLQRSKHKYQIRILAINILRLLGASSAAIAHFRVLNPKAIQNDTLSHLVLNRAATFSVTQDAAVLEEAVSASKWYKTGEHEAAEMAVRVFSYHNYSKVSRASIQSFAS